jgi:hypothetical protein
MAKKVAALQIYQLSFVWAEPEQNIFLTLFPINPLHEPTSTVDSCFAAGVHAARL